MISPRDDAPAGRFNLPAQRAIAERFARIGENVVRQSVIDKGLAEVAQKVLRNFALIIDLQQFGDRARHTLHDALPPNWRPIRVGQIRAVMQLMEETGWSLAWTVPATVLRQLLRGPDREAQETILIRHEALILDQISPLLDELDAPELIDVRTAAVESLEAYRGGYFWAAQSLSAATLSTTVHVAWGHTKFADAVQAFKKVGAPEQAGLRQMRLAAVLTAVLRTLDQHYPGDPVP